MSVYVPPSTGGGCSGSCQTGNDLKYNWISTYLNAHMLSVPSHRYAYLMWFVIVGMLLIGSAVYHLGIGDQTWVGAYWTKFAPKGRLVKVGRKPKRTATGALIPKKHKQALDAKEGSSAAAPQKIPKRYIFSLPSFGKILLITWMVAVPVVLTLVGADYIDPNASMFDMSASWPPRTSAPQKYSRRANIQWGLGDYIKVDTTVSFYSLPYHTWWTMGGRTGLMTNALTPFVVILSLKQVPWAVMSTKLFGRYSFEKMSFLHKWGGRLVFVFAFAHTITWSMQLRLDERNGEMVWGFIFLWPKFRWAFVAVGFLTLLTILSIGPIRRNYYEWFYFGHIVCAIGFMVATAFHHPPLAPWMWASLAWWGCERLTRAVKVAYINGIGFAGRKPDVISAHPPPQSSGTGPSSGAFLPNPFHQGPPSFTSRQAHPIDPFHAGLGGGSKFNRGTADSVGHQTQSSATLYEPSLAPHGTPLGHAMGSFHSSHSPEKAAWDLKAARGSGIGEEDEWDLDENGEKVTKRPSRRYGPVSEFIGDYAARPMSNIQEDYSSGTPPNRSGQGGDMEGNDPLQSSFSADDSTDLGSKMYFEDTPMKPSSRRASVLTDSYASESGPASSAEHYLSYDTQSRGHTSNGGHQGYELSERIVPAPQYNPSTPSQPSTLRANRPALPADVAAAIKPGFAFAQILPGKTLRLTLRTPNRMSWQPGQWVYLNIPSISGWQSHPFTIASAHDAHLPNSLSSKLGKSTGEGDLESGLAKGDKVKGEERTMVILIRVRKGFTLQLWEHVKKHRHRQVTEATTQSGQGAFLPVTLGKTTTGVHLRAIVDGPYGSTERVRWGVHSTVVIVCGGSGISFGITVLEHLCACLQEMNETGKTTRGGKDFSVQRIRFVWICREFSHLQWIASALRRCIEMIPPKQLQVDLYVTHINNQVAARNARPALGGQRASSFGDMLNGGRGTPHSKEGSNSPFGTGAATPPGGEPQAWKDGQGNVHAEPAYVGGREGEELQMEANDFTEFDEDEMAQPDADEMAINARIRDEGKLRRAHTRKVTLKRKGGRRGSKGGEEMLSGGDADSRDRELNTHDSLTLAAQNAMFKGAVESKPFLRAGQQQQQQRQPYGRDVRLGQAQPSSLGSHGPTQAPRGSETGTASPWPHTPAGLDGSRRGSWQSGMGPFDGADSGANTPFGHNVYNSFARRSSAHLLAADPIENPAGDPDSAIDLDEYEEQDLHIIAELAHMGHPRLDQVMADETHYAKGRTLVAGCGPANLSNLLRRIAVKHVDPARSRKGDKRGEVNLCMESFDWGG